MKNIFLNKTILVTGGTGSIGSVIVQSLVEKYHPKQIRIFDHNEESIFNASVRYADKKNVRFLIGDIRDRERIDWAVRDVNYVFHAAALKHVAINEYNPFEAIKTNILGTENLIMAAIKHNIDKFINISTDKASVPCSVMGASKLLAERITTAANYYKGNSVTICSSVRFGNVLASSGSVVPIFCQQIKNGGPVTVTDKRMIRYFMTIPQAVNLIFNAIQIARGGETFILKMPLLKIIDLAQILIEEFTKNKQKQIKIKETGIRPGEKLYEKLLTPLEKEYTLEIEKMYIIPPLVENLNLKTKEINQKIAYYKRLGAKPVNKNLSHQENLLNKKQIKNLLKEARIL